MPYSQVGLTQEKRIFNYRLSRARRVVENAFGILANRFRVFLSPIRLSPEKVETIVLACCTLHNYLRSKNTSRNVYTPPGSFDNENTDTGSVTPGTWQQGAQGQGLLSLARQGGNRSSTSAKDVQTYFWQWQDRMIN